MCSLILCEYEIGYDKGIEVQVHMGSNGEPMIGISNKNTGKIFLKTFIDKMIHYHNALVNELPTKYVVFIFWYTEDIKVLQKTVDIIESKKNEVNRPYIGYLFQNLNSRFYSLHSTDQFSDLVTYCNCRR